MIGTDVDPHKHHRASRRGRPTQEAVMGKAIPAQHPAVVLRSHYRHLRALLAIAMIAVVGLTAAVVILATNDDRDTSAGSASQAIAPGPAETRFDGPGEGSRGAVAAQPPVGQAAYQGMVPGQPPTARYDGGPEEGTAALTRRAAPGTVFDPDSITSPPSLRYDGGPEEGTRGTSPSNASSNAVPGTRYDGGPEEGSRGGGH
jgi:hypothetical protein